MASKERAPAGSITRVPITTLSLELLESLKVLYHYSPITTPRPPSSALEEEEEDEREED
jgi:hypothetical protein